MNRVGCQSSRFKKFLIFAKSRLSECWMCCIKSALPIVVTCVDWCWSGIKAGNLEGYLQRFRRTYPCYSRRVYPALPLLWQVGPSQKPMKILPGWFGVGRETQNQVYDVRWRLEGGFWLANIWLFLACEDRHNEDNWAAGATLLGFLF